MSDDYIYAAARVRFHELSLLTRQDMEQLASCRTYEDCLRTLRDKGWNSGDTADEVLTAEEEKTWAFVRELVSDLSPFDVLLCPTDYNNVKAAIKSVATGADAVNVFLPGGTVEPETLLKCAREGDFSPLPPAMAQAAEETYHTMLQTGDGQLCDVMLDRACLLGILEEGRRSGNRVINEYAQLTVSVADIKIAVRACKTGKDLTFLRTALAPCDTLDTDSLAAAACRGQEDLFAFLETSPYAQAAEKLKESYSAFEKWCDDRVMELIRGQKDEHFTVGPLFAYVLARKNEIGSVRVILSGKLNGLADEKIRERLRELYV